MEITDAIFMTFCCLMMLFVVRVEVTFRIRMKAIGRADVLGKAAIDERRPWEIYLDTVKAKSYNSILYDLRLWTAEKTYPELFTGA